MRMRGGAVAVSLLPHPRCHLLLGRLLGLALDSDGDGDFGRLDGRFGQGGLHREHAIGGQRGPHGCGFDTRGEAVGGSGEGVKAVAPTAPWTHHPTLHHSGCNAVTGDRRSAPNFCFLPLPVWVSSIPSLASGHWRGWVGGQRSPKTSGGCQDPISPSPWYLRVFSGEAPGDEAVFILLLLVFAWKKKKNGMVGRGQLGGQ